MKMDQVEIEIGITICTEIFKKSNQREKFKFNNDIEIERKTHTYY